MRKFLDNLKALLLMGFYIGRVYWMPRSRSVLFPMAAIALVAGATMSSLQPAVDPPLASAKKSIEAASRVLPESRSRAPD